MIFSKGERDGLPVPDPPQLLRPGRRRQEHNPPSDYHKGICLPRYTDTLQLVALDCLSILAVFVLRSISVFTHSLLLPS